MLTAPLTPPSGSVASVGLTFTGGILSIAGSPITGSGTFAITIAGTSGGIPYFTSATGWASSAALAANALVIGGGAGAAPATTTTGTGVLSALGNAVNAASGVPVLTAAGKYPALDGSLITGITAGIGTGDSPTLSGVWSWAQSIAANTATAFITLTNTGTASSGNQMHSGALVWAGAGWKTTATAASQAVAFRAHVVPVQGTTAPTGQWTLGSSINGAAYTNLLIVDSTNGVQCRPINTAGYDTAWSVADETGALLALINRQGNLRIGTGISHGAGGDGAKLEITSGSVLFTNGANYIRINNDLGSVCASSGFGAGSSALSGAKWNVVATGLQSMSGTTTPGGTTGAQTISKPCGVVNFAAGASALVVTNTLASATTLIFAQVLGTDATATSVRVTRASGSFTLTLNAAATAETAVEFLVLGAPL